MPFETHRGPHPLSGRRTPGYPALLLAALLGAPAPALADGWGSGSWGTLTWGGDLPISVPTMPFWSAALLALLLLAVSYAVFRRGGRFARIALVCLALVPVTAYAAQISAPFAFVNGTVADANQVNANFDALVSESNDQDTRIGALETASGDLATHASDPAAHHAKTTSFGELSDVASDAQIPAGIARDGEVFGLIDTTGSFLRSDAPDAYTGALLQFSTGTDVHVNGILRIGQDSGTDDDAIYFDFNGSQSIAWVDSDDRFRVSDDLRIEGLLHAGYSDTSVRPYNAIANSAAALPESGVIDSSADLFVAGQVELGAGLYLSGELFVEGSGATGADGDQYIYFYEGDSRFGEHLRWDDALSRFVVSDDFTARTAHFGIGDTTDRSSYNSISNSAASGLAPESAQINGSADLWISDDLEVSDVVYVGAAGMVSTPTVEIRGGSDLSESFRVAVPSRSEVAAATPGSVVCIDPTRPGMLRVCDSAYDRTVVGVVSGAGGVDTGLLMGQEGTLAHGDVPVALTGRVYVQADAGERAVAPGDLLTTSDVPGHAVAVSDHARAQGAVIGKAMTGLESGRGLILVLVSLQ